MSGENEIAGKVISGRKEDVKTEEQNEGKRLSTEIKKEQTEKTERRREFGRKPEVYSDSAPEVFPDSAPAEAASLRKTAPHEIHASVEDGGGVLQSPSPGGVTTPLPGVQAFLESFPDNKTPPDQDGTGEAEDSFFGKAASSKSYRPNSKTSILKGSESRRKNLYKHTALPHSFLILDA